MKIELFVLGVYFICILVYIILKEKEIRKLDYRIKKADEELELINIQIEYQKIKVDRLKKSHKK